MMNKKLFICGKVYELTTNQTATVIKKIQRVVDKICNDPENPERRLVGFSMQVTPIPNNTDLDIELTFARNNMFAKEGINTELINDSDGQLLMGLNGSFKPPVMWDSVQTFAFGRYHIPIKEFIYAYAESAKALGASGIIGLQIEISKAELKLKIRI